jgi:hypothetical protein
MIIVFVALMTPPANAVFPNLLPIHGTYNVTAGATELGGSIVGAWKSGATKGGGAITGEKTGTLTLVLEKTKDGLGTTCTGLSDTTAANVTTTGTTELRWDTIKTKVLLLFKLNELHGTCGITLFKEKGCVAGIVEGSANIPLTELRANLTVNERDNVPVTVENATNTGTENCELKTETNDENPVLASETAFYTFKEFARGIGERANQLEIMTK